MQKVIRLIMFFIVAVQLSSFNVPNREKINWISIEQLNEMYYNDPKPILVDVYTNWCGWCKQMDKTTYENEKLVSYVNTHYYAVKFNAESRDSLSFNKKKYGYDARYKSSELAKFLLFGNMQYPTTVFLSSIDAQPAPLVGFMKAKEMEAPLKYFGEKENAKQTFVEFNQKMKAEW